MAQFFQTVSDFIVTIYKYIKYLVSGVLAIPQLFDTVGLFLENALSYVPVEIMMFVVVIVFICILFHMIGR